MKRNISKRQHHRAIAISHMIAVGLTLGAVAMIPAQASSYYLTDDPTGVYVRVIEAPPSVPGTVGLATYGHDGRASLMVIPIRQRDRAHLAGAASAAGLPIEAHCEAILVNSIAADSGDATDCPNRVTGWHNSGDIPFCGWADIRQQKYMFWSY